MRASGVECFDHTTSANEGNWKPVMGPIYADGARNASNLRRPGTRGLAVLGGVAAQGSQALTSFVLQVLAVRTLGLDGLGRFATLFAGMILATAVSSGFVGDSLTVLDRSAPSIRAGLQTWALLIPGGAALIASLVVGVTAFLGLGGAVIFGAAVAVYMVEDLIRRLLMATLLFWRITVVDGSVLVGTVGSLLALAAIGQLDLSSFLVAMTVGQAVGILVGMLLLPATERKLAPLRHADLRAVTVYGRWRAVQQLIRPALLAGVRVVCVVMVGLAATGQLEAARIYVAPGLLLVAGVSSFLFASYAADRGIPLPVLLARADRSVLLLVLAVGGFGAVAVILEPWIGPLLTDGQYVLQLPSVLGWVCYAASVAAVTPYGSLAAVRGRQVAVLLWRTGDSLLSLLAVVLVVTIQGSAEWVPIALSVGSLLGGIGIRQFVLRRDNARGNESA